MSITTRIESISNHLENAYNSLENIGVDLTGVNKNISNLSTEIDALYPDLKKVTAEDTEITLNSTKVGKMEISLKGNSNQKTTIGKNISYFNPQSENRIFYRNSYIYIKNPLGYSYSKWNLSNDTSLSGKTYTIYMRVNGTKEAGTSLSIIIGKTNNNYAFQKILDASATSFVNDVSVGTVTLNEGEVFRSLHTYMSKAIADLTVEVMVVEGNYPAQTIGDFEPYSGKIPGPNPNYKQYIQNATSNNKITIENKNMLCFVSNSDRGITFNNSEINISNPTGYLNNVFNIAKDYSRSGKTYTIYMCINGTKEAGKSLSIMISKTNSNYAYEKKLDQDQTTFNNDIKVATVTLGTNEVFTKCQVYVASETTANLNVKVMIVEGNYTSETIGEYIAYQNQLNYINLGYNLYANAIKTANTTTSDNTIITDNSDKLEIQGVNGYYSGIYKKYLLKPNTPYSLILTYSEKNNIANAAIRYKIGSNCDSISNSVNDGSTNISNTARTPLYFATDETGLVAIMFVCNWNGNEGHVIYLKTQIIQNLFLL